VFGAASITASIALFIAVVTSDESNTMEASTKYYRLANAVLPLPTLNLLVSVSKPISPAPSTGFAAAHCAAVPLRCCILVAIFYFLLGVMGIIITDYFS